MEAWEAVWLKYMQQVDTTLCARIMEAIRTLRNTGIKKVDDGIVKAYWVGPIIRVDVDERALG